MYGGFDEIALHLFSKTYLRKVFAVEQGRGYFTNWFITSVYMCLIYVYILIIGDFQVHLSPPRSQASAASSKP